MARRTTAPTRRLSKPTQYYMGEKINQGADLPLFSGTAPAANVQEFRPEEQGQQPALFDRPPVEMRTRTTKRPTTETPAALLNVERIGE